MKGVPVAAAAVRVAGRAEAVAQGIAGVAVAMPGSEGVAPMAWDCVGAAAVALAVGVAAEGVGALLRLRPQGALLLAVAVAAAARGVDVGVGEPAPGLLLRGGVRDKFGGEADSLRLAPVLASAVEEPVGAWALGLPPAACAAVTVGRRVGRLLLRESVGEGNGLGDAELYGALTLAAGEREAGAGVRVPASALGVILPPVVVGRSLVEEGERLARGTVGLEEGQRVKGRVGRAVTAGERVRRGQREALGVEVAQSEVRQEGEALW
jgi:hypothetical protein